MKHIHAELMLQYAQDAMETDKPWERWEYFSIICDEWIRFTDDYPTWVPEYKYRRTKETIVINGYEVPKPVDKPLDYGDKYYLVDLHEEKYFNEIGWRYDYNDNLWLERGLIHLDKESAIIHAKALLSFTTKDTDE